LILLPLENRRQGEYGVYVFRATSLDWSTFTTTGLLQNKYIIDAALVNSNLVVALQSVPPTFYKSAFDGSTWQSSSGVGIVGATGYSIAASSDGTKLAVGTSPLVVSTSAVQVKPWLVGGGAVGGAMSFFNREQLMISGRLGR